MSNHTRGPWHVLGTMILGPDSERLVPVAIMGLSDCFDTQANARLIAAAPDMLEALKLILIDPPESDFANELQRRVDLAQAAITKATGGAE